MSDSIMRDKAKDFAKKIVFLCRNMNEYRPIQNECGAIRRMLISSLKTIKSNNL